MKNYGDRGGCYRPRRITPWEISIILHMNSALRTPGHPLIITDSLHCAWGKKALALFPIEFNPRTYSLIQITGFPYFN